MANGYQDLAITEAVARIASLEADLVGYRQMMQIALAQSHAHQREVQRLCGAYHAALDELRQLRKVVA